MKKNLLLLFVGLTSTLNAQIIELAVDYVEQEQTEWCSAASAECVLGFKGINESQCNIMEYVRLQNILQYGITQCCINPNGSCNNGVPLGIDNEKGSVKDILWYFGELPSKGNWSSLWISYIEDNITQNRPIIVQLDYNDLPAAHAVVIYGIEKEDLIDYVHYMDPGPMPPLGLGGKQRLPWETFHYNALWWWKGTLELKSCSLERDYPCHCFNGEQDGNETGIDCGGSCWDCYTPPPPPPTADCTNCKKEYGAEEEIDCGGKVCPPCEDLPEEIIIEDRLYNYNWEVMATKKITTKGYTIVSSGKKVNFFTEDDGLIILKPGFIAQRGSNFSAYTKDLSEYSRICPENLCETAKLQFVYYPRCQLKITDLLYAKKIKYVIYNAWGEIIYENEQNITRNGTFKLWETYEFKDAGYVAYCSIDYCNEMKISLLYDFVYYHEKCWKMKSSTEEPEEPEGPPQFSSPNPNSIALQDDMGAPVLTIIPNPNPGTFQIETNFPLSDIANFKVTNLLGTAVYETQNLVSNTIQLPNSATGLYFVIAVLRDGAVLTRKMMIQR